MQLTKSVELDGSAARVWAVLGEGFADLRWTRSVRASRLEGEWGPRAVRVCEFEPSFLVRSGKAREQLVEFDSDARVLAYALLDPSAPIQTAGSRWQVDPLGNGRCRVTVTATIVLRPWARLFSPALRLMVGRLTKQTFDDLAARVSAPGPAAEKTRQPLAQPGR